MLGGPQDHPQVLWFSGKTHRTEHVVILRARISYSKRRQSKVITGKRSVGQGLGDTKRERPRAPSSGAPRHMLNAPPHQLGVTMRVKCCQPWKIVRNSVPRGFYRGTSCRHTLQPGIYPASRLPEGNWVFSLNHIVCTNSLSSESHSHSLGNVGTLPKATFPDASQGPTLQAGLPKTSSHACSVNSPWHSS